MARLKHTNVKHMKEEHQRNKHKSLPAWYDNPLELRGP